MGRGMNYGTQMNLHESDDGLSVLTTDMFVLLIQLILRLLKCVFFGGGV